MFLGLRAKHAVLIFAAAIAFNPPSVVSRPEETQSGLSFCQSAGRLRADSFEGQKARWTLRHDKAIQQRNLVGSSGAGKRSNSAEWK